MDLKLSGQKVLITGASQGIGEGAALAFAAEGCSLVLVARNDDKLDALADRLRSEFHATVDVLAVDLTQAGALKRLGAIEFVSIPFNNAGTIPGGDLQIVDADGWRRACDLKFTVILIFAVYFMSK